VSSSSELYPLLAVELELVLVLELELELCLELFLELEFVYPSLLQLLPPKKEHKTNPINKIRKRNNACEFIVYFI